jgi:hypothetical protein
MSAPKWLHGIWAKLRQKKAAKIVAREREERRALVPLILDEQWIAANKLVDKIGEAYNAKGLHEVMKAVDEQPHGLWKLLIARLIATARRYSKDLHEQSLYITEALASAEAKEREAKQTIETLTKARREDGEAARRDLKERDAQIASLLSEKVDLMERVARAEKAEAIMVEQVKAANEFRESMRGFVQTTGIEKSETTATSEN